MYKAIETFTDLQDNNHRYQAGDIFPREGLRVTKKRLEDLLTGNNKRHKPMIEEIPEEIPEETKKPVPKKGKKNAK